MTKILTGLSAAAIALFANIAPLQAEILLEGHRSKVTIHSAERLKGEVKKDFAHFKKNADYYGALYVNQQEDISAEFWDTRNMELAKQSARKSCHLKSQNPSHCELYATVGPKTPATGNGVTLSQTGNRLFKKYQRLQKDGKFGAFATTDFGAPGYSWGYDTEIEAKASAIRGCESSIEKINSNTSAHIVQNVMKNEGDTCRVIHVARP